MPRAPQVLPVVLPFLCLCCTQPAPPQPLHSPDHWHAAPDSLVTGDEASQGPFQTITLTPPGGTIQVALSAGELAVTQADLLKWINTASSAVTNFYGHFPVKHLTLTIIAGGDEPIGQGVTYEGKHIHIAIGKNATLKQLNADWVLTHEMFHLAFPDVGEGHAWMTEGLSTYLEPIARARIGNITAEKVWTDVVHDMPQGLPEPNDQGLEHTHTWGRTYWGGCMFWLLADTQIRQQTNNRHSLDDALKVILDKGGDGSETWSVDQVIATGDGATGTTVIKDLYAKMANAAYAPDLQSLWQQLGITKVRNKITFDDSSPLAEIRKSMSAPPANKP